MTIPDPLIAVRAFIAADAAVLLLVPAARVFVSELPASEVASQPRSAVEISSIGGPGSRDFMRLGRRSIAVRCYGTTHFTAMKLHNAVHEALKHLERVVQNTVLVHGVTLESGPIELREPDGDWPFVYATYEVLAAETAAA